MNLHHPSNLSVDLSASDPQLVTTDENAALVAWINPPTADEFAMTENPLADAKLLAAAWNAFVSAGPELGVDAAELAASFKVVHVVKLLDRLSDMIEDGRLKKADIPDDYAWLVDQLAEINQPLPLGSGPNEAPAIEASPLAAQALESKAENVWNDFPPFPREDWQVAAGTGETNLGYWEWVLTRIEASDEAGGQD
jgi:hypothetical protein